MIKKLSFLILILVTTFGNAQNNRPIFYGKVVDSIGSLANVHVINLYTNQGTYTNDNGEFRIFAQENDSLQLSFVGYQTKKILLQSTNFGLSENKFILKKQTELLDEVVLKKHNLTGSLALDIKQVPKDRLNEMMTTLMDGIMRMDFSSPIIEEIDEIDRSKAPIVKTDPISNGASLYSGSIFTSKKKIIQQKKIDRVKRKDQFYVILFNNVSKDYFTNELKIPKENIYHFIDYCSTYKVQKLVSEDKILELLKHFEEQSVAYLEIIKK